MSIACKRQMRPSAITVEIVNRQTDRLVEGLDAFAVAARRFSATLRELFRENQLWLAPRCGTTVALEVVR